MSASLVGTTRTAGQLRGVLARVALAASQIAAAYERSLGVPFVSGPSGFSLRRSVRLWLHRLGRRVLLVSS
jgi:hypothetical protein